MRRLRILLIVTIIGILSAPVVSNPKKKKIHKFTDTKWNSGESPCQICHAVLDHMEEGESSRKVQYVIYDSPTIDAYTGQPDGVSKFCLSCHDGTVAEDKGIKAEAPNLKSDLSDDHPVSFVYDEELALVDDKLFNPGTALSGLGNTIQDDLLRNKKLQCVSCHDVHGLSGQKHLLVKTNLYSALCFTCHNK